MGGFLTGADLLDRVIVERLYPVFLPFSDPARLPRWSKDMFTLDMFILDPERQELFAQQDYDAHRRYWDRLYGWMSKVSKGIIDVHAAWNLGFGRSLAAIVWLAGRGLRYILAGSC